MASALATPHTATRPSSLSSSFGLSSSLSFIFMLLFWLFWLFWLVLLGFAFCSAFCSSSIFCCALRLTAAASKATTLQYGSGSTGTVRYQYCTGISGLHLFFSSAQKSQLGLTRLQLIP